MTPFGKGFFVFDADKESTSLDEFVDTVTRSALGTNNPVYTRQMAEHSSARAAELRAWGFFDQTLANQPFMKPVEVRGIPLIERVVITHSLKEDGRIVGAAGFRLDAEETITIQAKSVILCTGSEGFNPSGFPVCDLTHDGSIMVYRIGAKVTGKEWNDGHNTRAVYPAACYDNWEDMFSRIPSTNGVDVYHDLGVDINYRAAAVDHLTAFTQGRLLGNPICASIVQLLYILGDQHAIDVVPGAATDPVAGVLLTRQQVGRSGAPFEPGRFGQCRSVGVSHRKAAKVRTTTGIDAGNEEARIACVLRIHCRVVQALSALP